jgi:HSP20 family protein
VEVVVMLLRTDPFREVDRLAQQLVGAGTAARPAVMAMDAWRENDGFVVEGNVLTVRAERPNRADQAEVLAAERPTGLFSRQLVLGENLDLEQVKAEYERGVLRLRIPVAAKAQPRKISITTDSKNGSGAQAQISS